MLKRKRQKYHDPNHLLRHIEDSDKHSKCFLVLFVDGIIRFIYLERVSLWGQICNVPSSVGDRLDSVT
jgi:hypothetical protein